MNQQPPLQDFRKQYESSQSTLNDANLDINGFVPYMSTQKYDIIPNYINTSYVSSYFSSPSSASHTSQASALTQQFPQPTLGKVHDSLQETRVDFSSVSLLSVPPSLPKKAPLAVRKRKRPLPTKRVRTGCLTCRKRKKKCTEEKPNCFGCLRNHRECSWPDPDAPARINRKKLENSAIVTGNSSNSEAEFELGEPEIGGTGSASIHISHNSKNVDCLPTAFYPTNTPTPNFTHIPYFPTEPQSLTFLLQPEQSQQRQLSRQNPQPSNQHHHNTLYSDHQHTSVPLPFSTNPEFTLPVNPAQYSASLVDRSKYQSASHQQYKNISNFQLDLEFSTPVECSGQLSSEFGKSFGSLEGDRSHLPSTGCPQVAVDISALGPIAGPVSFNDDIPKPDNLDPFVVALDNTVPFTNPGCDIDSSGAVGLLAPHMSNNLIESQGLIPQNLDQIPSLNESSSNEFIQEALQFFDCAHLQQRHQQYQDATENTQLHAPIPENNNYELKLKTHSTIIVKRKCPFKGLRVDDINHMSELQNQFKNACKKLKFQMLPMQNPSFRIDGIPTKYYNNVQHFVHKFIPVLTLPHSRDKFSLFQHVVPYIGQRPEILHIILSISWSLKAMENPSLSGNIVAHYNKAFDLTKKLFYSKDIDYKENWIMLLICLFYLFEIWNGDKGKRARRHISFLPKILNLRFPNDGKPLYEKVTCFDIVWIESYIYHLLFCAYTEDLSVPLKADRVHASDLRIHTLAFDLLSPLNVKNIFGAKPWLESPIFGISHDIFRVLFEIMLMSQYLPWSGSTLERSAELLIYLKNWVPPGVSPCDWKPLAAFASKENEFDLCMVNKSTSPILDHSGDLISSTQSPLSNTIFDDMLAPAFLNTGFFNTGDSPSNFLAALKDTNYYTSLPELPDPNTSVTISSIGENNGIKGTIEAENSTLSPPASCLFDAFLYQQYAIVQLHKYSYYPSLDYVFASPVRIAIQNVMDELSRFDLVHSGISGSLEWCLSGLSVCVIDEGERQYFLQHLKYGFAKSSRKHTLSILERLTSNWQFIDDYICEKKNEM